MAIPQIVIDTNVIVAAFHSRRGAAHRLLSLIDAGRYETHVSVPLVLEYEDVLSRPKYGLSPEEIRDVVDYFCKVGAHCQVYFLWRPHLSDPKDDMVLELAVSSACDYIITYNTRDFQGIAPFGLKAIRPIEFLRILGEIP